MLDQQEATMKNKQIDPVCGMEVDPATAAGKATHDGKEYFFCSPGCKTAFEAEPARFLGGGTSSAHQHSGHH